MHVSHQPHHIFLLIYSTCAFDFIHITFHGEMALNSRFEGTNCIVPTINIVSYTDRSSDSTKFWSFVLLLQVTDKEKEELGESIIVKTVPYTDTLLRFVLHCDISSGDVQRAIAKFSYVLQELS
jgi:hypothetical protein